MVCSASCVKLLKSIALTLLVAGLTVAQALAAAALRPAVVPQDFVVTPFGYYHPSCINHLAKGDVLRQDIKAIERANGITQNIELCAYPHYLADGQKVMADAPAPKDPPNISHAWIEYASITTTGAYGQIYTEWEVPPSPTSNDGQTVYLFNGMEDSNDVVTIIQPVLGWNSDYSAAWSIAAWNCCVNGQVNEATPAHTNPGDHLEGYVFMNCVKGTRVCSSWDIVIVDEESGAFSELLDTSNYSQQFNWAFGGVLEVYNIAQCTDYPPPDYAGGIGFHNESVLNAQFAVVSNPAWTVTNLASGLTPQCSYGGSLPKQVTLTY
ncbi:MAG TPA: hypothetical protein VGG14_04390 [Candidatus Sulfotelmatobacter sp.]